MNSVATALLPCPPQSVHRYLSPLSRPPRFVLHARWPVAVGPKNDTYNIGYNPQLTLVVTNGQTATTGGGSVAAGGAAAAVAPKSSPTVWVLLSRWASAGKINHSYLICFFGNVRNTSIAARLWFSTGFCLCFFWFSRENNVRAKPDI